jgi:1-aminocyclopropane-1-carboxylate deaminase/D-cysteine desulfhydrase-like pyridoxal-dependent ACC family enzyme
VSSIVPSLNNISLDSWDHVSFRKHDLKTDVLRLDKIHPEISGNKWFKLKYYLERAVLTQKDKLISFGGAYSNHLLALAAAARLYGFASVGLIRGEEPDILSPVLVTLKQFGMELRFLSRAEYDRQKKSLRLSELEEYEQQSLLIPEGGGGRDGVRGAEEILKDFPIEKYTHICCAVGTGTTLAGIINSTSAYQKKIGVSILKGTRHLEPLSPEWITFPGDLDNVQMIHEDHFGGYARYTKDLITFMNQTYASSGIPTDFVYTGKLFYSVVRMAEINAFPAGSRILILHTGGLPGNRSLAPGLLQF